MKATGIVRRIDDLGRVVIPKEIRRTQMIRVGDPLEIFVSSTGEVIFKKYSPVGELAGEAEHLVEALYKNAGVSALVTDRDKVVAAAGSLRPAAGQALAPEYSSRMEARRLYAQDGTLFDVCSGVGAGRSGQPGMRGYAGSCGGVLSGAQAGRVNTGRRRHGAALFCY